MNLRLGIVNMVLALLLLFMIVKIMDVWRKTDVLPENAAQADGKPLSADGLLPATAVQRRAPEAAYELIATKNLFSRDRAEYVPPVDHSEEPEIVETTVEGKTITLFGVIRMDGYASALVSNPEPKTGERPTLWVKKDDRIGGLTVDAILDDAVVLAEGNKKYKILLHDKDRPKQREAAMKVETPNIVTTSAAEKKELKKPAAPAPVVEGEYEFVKTPFGTVKRRKN